MHIKIFFPSGYRVRATFELQISNDPESDLKNLFDNLLNHAVNESALIKPNYYIFQLYSPQLSYEITHHFKLLDQNTAEEILHKFQRFDQSNTSKERPSAITTPFDIDIHAISLKKTESNGNRKRAHPGAGKPFKRLQPINFEINPDGLFRLNNNDRYCLFRSLVFTIAHATLTRQRFSEFKNDDHEQAQMIKNLMQSCGIQRGLPFYDIEDVGDAVQNLYLDVAYPGRFKIFAFENQGLLKPFFRSNAEHYTDCLCIFYWAEDSHYDPIRSMQKLLGNDSRQNYCFAVKNKILQMTKTKFFIFLSVKFHIIPLFSTV